MTAERGLRPRTLTKGLVDSKLNLFSHCIGQLFVVPRKSILYRVNSNRARGLTSRSHTSEIVPARLSESIWCSKFQSSFLNNYFRFSGFQSSLLLIHFRHGPEQVFTLHQSMTQYLSDMRHSTFVAQFRSITEISEIATTVLVRGSVKASRQSIYGKV